MPVFSAGVPVLTLVEPGRGYLVDVPPGILVFAAGLALTVAALTTAALASLESKFGGIASGVNNAVARTASLVAIAAVPLIAGFSPSGDISNDTLVDGFRRVVWSCAAVAVVSAIVSAVWIRRPGPQKPEPKPLFHCAAQSPPAPVAVGADELVHT